jgi:hypothetical protein
MSVFEQSLDSQETRDFVIDWTAPLADVDDTIATHPVTRDAAAAAAAVEVFASALDVSGLKVVFWLRSTNPAVTAAAAGGYAGVICAITTTGGRTWRFAARVLLAEAA